MGLDRLHENDDSLGLLIQIQFMLDELYRRGCVIELVDGKIKAGNLPDVEEDKDD